MTRESEIFEVMQAPHRYCDAINRKDLEDTLSVYAESARWQIPALRIDVQGKDNLREWCLNEGIFRTHAGQFVTQQIGAQRLVRYTTDVANVYTHFNAQRVDVDGSGFQYFMVYDDEMVRNNGTWEVTDRIGHFLFRSATGPVGVPIPCPPLRRSD